ncbi:MAG: hypothetical protein FWD64_02130 [Acidobacteriaceae bacterium]|nr:hypothetical protein [Acidobacteriaceae bacterium]
MTGPLLWTALVCLLLGGCRHKVVTHLQPRILTPVALEDIPEQELPLIAPEDMGKARFPVASAIVHPRHERRRPAVKATVTPPAVTSETADPRAESSGASLIGALSTASSTDPRAQQEATQLIASIDRRIGALPSRKLDEQKAQISKVRNFQKQAQQALNSGDMDGARTLATKAKLLLDDIEK